MLHQLENSENKHQIQEKAAGKEVLCIQIEKIPQKIIKEKALLSLYGLSSETKKSFEETAGVKNCDLSIITHEMPPSNRRR